MTPNSCSQLELGKDISASNAPLHPPTTDSKRILVIGGGVTGLVTAWLLLDKGYHVTIISKQWASYTKSQRLTSQIAGALWELPPGGCGPQPVSGSICHCRDWAIESYGIYCAIAADPRLAAGMGVQMRSLAMLFPYSIEGDDTKMEKMKAIENSAIRGFRRSPSVIKKLNISPEFGIVDAYEHDAPVIDSDRGMQFLMQLVRNKGAELVTGEIKGQLWDSEVNLLATFSADCIVNAAGLGAHALAADDSVYPVRGGVLRLVNDGTDFPRVTTAAVVSTETDETGNYRDVIFMVPRNDDILILGSIVQPHEWVTNLGLESPEVKDLRARFERFMPALKYARLDPEYPFAQGLRPFRLGSPRVGRETKTRAGGPSRIVHSYGHGGAGWSLAFGCAAECVGLVDEILLKEREPLKSDDRPAITTPTSFTPEIPNSDSGVTLDEEEQFHLPVQGDSIAKPSGKRSRSLSGPGRVDDHDSDWVFDVFAEDDGGAEGDGSPASKQARSSPRPLEAAENGMPLTGAVKDVQMSGSVHGDRPLWGDQECTVPEVIGEPGSDYEVTVLIKLWLHVYHKFHLVSH